MLLLLLACTQSAPPPGDPTPAVQAAAPAPRRVDLKFAVASAEPCDEGICLRGALLAPAVWEGMEVRVPVNTDDPRAVKAWTPGRELCVRLEGTPALVQPPAVTQIATVAPRAIRSCERYTP